MGGSFIPHADSIAGHPFLAIVNVDDQERANHRSIPHELVTPRASILDTEWFKQPWHCVRTFHSRKRRFPALLLRLILGGFEMDFASFEKSRANLIQRNTQIQTSFFDHLEYVALILFGNRQRLIRQIGVDIEQERATQAEKIWNRERLECSPDRQLHFGFQISLFNLLELGNQFLTQRFLAFLNLLAQTARFMKWTP